jgi:hypothetical protein
VADYKIRPHDMPPSSCLALSERFPSGWGGVQPNETVHRALHTSVTGRGMRRVARGVQRIRSLPAWLRMVAMVAAVSAVLPWDALAHGKREHDSAAKTNSARHPAKHEPGVQAHPRRRAHGKAAHYLPPPPAPSGIRRDDPLAPPWVIRAVAPHATAAGLAPSLLLAVAWRESGFATTATPGNGSTAAGMFQFNEDALAGRDPDLRPQARADWLRQPAQA